MGWAQADLPTIPSAALGVQPGVPSYGTRTPGPIATGATSAELLATELSCRLSPRRFDEGFEGWRPIFFTSADRLVVSFSALDSLRSLLWAWVSALRASDLAWRESFRALRSLAFAPRKSFFAALRRRLASATFRLASLATARVALSAFTSFAMSIGTSCPRT